MVRLASKKTRMPEIVQRLAELYPGTAKELCALDYDGPFQLVIATILSAQCTDARVNMVTPSVFARYRDASTLSAANPDELEEMIRTTGFFRSKTKNLIGMATVLLERFDGVVPKALEDLVMLPGVGRKTGNVVRSVAFGLPGLPVDTHVTRLSGRLGLTKSTNPEQIERELNALIAPQEGGTLSLRLILHGRAVCVARSPRCGVCILADLCPSAPVYSAQAAARPARGRPRA